MTPAEEQIRARVNKICRHHGILNGVLEGDLAAALTELLAELGRLQAPIDMILHCPACGLQHIDAPDEVPNQPIHKSAPTPEHPHRMVQVGTYTAQGEWKNPPHRSHLCHGCGHIWRPADVPTNGVAEIKTKGKDDSPSVDPKAELDRLRAERKPLTSGDRLWLWRNGDHYLAFRHEFPCYSPGGDPMTLGNPAPVVVEFRESHDRAHGITGD